MDEVQELEFTENGIGIKPVSKGWETRRANKAKKLAEEAAKVVTAGITEQQSKRLRNLMAFAFEKREAFAAAEQELRDAEQTLSSFIESITAK